MELRVEDVHKRFGAVVALDGVSLAAGPGSHLLLAGANGAGKTTLLRLLAGLTSPTQGRVRLDDQDPRRSPALRRGYGLLSHQTLLYDDLTAAENLRFFCGLYGLDPGLVPTALAAVSLSEHAEARAGGFSRGMKQRLALARATLHDPDLLLLDEPFTGLDRRSARTLSQDLAQRAARPGALSVMVTHSAAEAATLVNRVLVLRRGRIVCDQAWDGADGGALQALCDRHQEPEVHA